MSEKAKYIKWAFEALKSAAFEERVNQSREAADFWRGRAAEWFRRSSIEADAPQWAPPLGYKWEPVLDATPRPLVVLEGDCLRRYETYTSASSSADVLKGVANAVHCVVLFVRKLGENLVSDLVGLITVVGEFINDVCAVRMDNDVKRLDEFNTLNY